MKDINGVEIQVGQKVLYANSERGFVKGRVSRIETRALPRYADGGTVYDGPVRTRVTIATEGRYGYTFPASKGERVLVLA